jgi:hypothetical protein
LRALLEKSLGKLGHEVVVTGERERGASTQRSGRIRSCNQRLE